MKRQIRIVEGANGCTIEVLYPPFHEWDVVSSWSNQEEAIKALVEYERLYALAEAKRSLKKLSKSD